MWGSDQLRFFLDGEQLGSTVSTSGALIETETQETFFAGSGGAGYKCCEGAIDEVRISSTRRYSSSFEPPRHFELDSNAVLLWHLNEASGSTADDETSDDFDGTVYGSAERQTRVEWGRDYTYDTVGNRLQMTKNDGIGDDVTYSCGYNGFGQRVAPAGMLWAI